MNFHAKKSAEAAPLRRATRSSPASNLYPVEGITKHVKEAF